MIVAIEKQDVPLSQEIAERGTILRCEAGSTVHGIAVAGTDDRDELGVCIEPQDFVIGLRHFEQYVHRSKPQGVRSEPGDLDLTIYCHAPDSLVLTAGLEWVPIQDIRAGAKVIAFDEAAPTRARHRHFKTGRVVATQTRQMGRCCVKTDRGSSVVTPDHPFLVMSKTPPRMRWVKACDLKEGARLYFIQPWTRDESWGGGYLAGQYDGEASLHFTDTPASDISWTQKASSPEIMMIREMLIERGFATRLTSSVSGCARVHIAGEWINQMRFLGSIRPYRLLRHPKLQRMWENRSLQACEKAVVEQVVALPPGPMVAMEVDARTYIADGFLGHNSLRKFASLALKGNPSILLLFNVPTEKCSIMTPAGAELRRSSWAFASKRAGAAFLGYMQQQRQRLMGERGQMNVKRPELVEQYGYDVKYAAHILRLGFQGIDYMTSGTFPVPMTFEQRELILSVRQGQIAENEVLTKAGELEAELKIAIDSSPLPNLPDYALVNALLVNIYQEVWAEWADA